MIEEYPNISKERALQSINTVVLYLRQLKLENNFIERKAIEVEQLIGALEKRKD